VRYAYAFLATFTLGLLSRMVTASPLSITRF
jgi:hypothetical protein